MPNLNPGRAIPGARPAVSDRALDSAESLKTVRRWDAARITALAEAYRTMQLRRQPPTPPTWNAALSALEAYAVALQVTERATAERAEVAATFAHVALAGLAAGVRDWRLP